MTLAITLQWTIVRCPSNLTENRFVYEAIYIIETFVIFVFIVVVVVVACQ